MPNEYELAECITWLVDRERAKVQGPGAPQRRASKAQAVAHLHQGATYADECQHLRPPCFGAVMAARCVQLFQVTLTEA